MEKLVQDGKHSKVERQKFELSIVNGGRKMVANKTTKYPKILEDEKTLEAFFDKCPNLGALLGFYKYTKNLIDEMSISGTRQDMPKQDDILSTQIDLWKLKKKLGEMILSEMTSRHRRVDHREHWTMCAYLGDLGFEVVHLETGQGDITSRKVSIERKEDDLIPSLFDGRRLRQLSAMRETAEYSFLIVTKSYTEIKAGLQDRQVSEQIFISFIASLCAVGYPPIFIDNRYDAAQVMHSIIGKIEVDNHRLYVPRPKGAKPTSFRNAMIEALPKVGFKTRRKLVLAFPSIAKLVAASIEEIQAIEGIGKKTAEKIWHCLHDE